MVYLQTQTLFAIISLNIAMKDTGFNVLMNDTSTEVTDVYLVNINKYESWFKFALLIAQKI